MEMFVGAIRVLCQSLIAKVPEALNDAAGPPRAPTHLLNGILICNLSNKSKLPDSHEYDGSFIRGMFLH